VLQSTYKPSKEPLIDLIIIKYLFQCYVKKLSKFNTLIIFSTVRDLFILFIDITIQILNLLRVNSRHWFWNTGSSSRNKCLYPLMVMKRIFIKLIIKSLYWFNHVILKGVLIHFKVELLSFKFWIYFIKEKFEEFKYIYLKKINSQIE
jgi:hypothetical protein